MKNKKLLSVLSLGIISSFLASCGSSEISYVAPKKFTEQLGIEVKADASGEIDVRQDEDGQVIILNDPNDDPSLKTITSLKLEVSQKVLFYSSSGKSGFNETFKPELKVLPYSARNSKVVWSSDNPEVASVSENGEIKALSEGVANIKVASEDGSVSDSMRITVNDTFVIASKSIKSATKILAFQNDPSFKIPQPLYVSQRFNKKETINDAVVATSDDTEEMTLSEEDAYFRITANGTETIVEGGSAIPSVVDYIFYTNIDYDTYCINTVSKHVLKIDQSHLVNKKTRFEALCEVLDSFFVAGSSIVTKLPGELTGYEELYGRDYNSHEYIGSLGEDSGEFAYTQIRSQKFTASAQDEEDMDIPAGEQVIVDDKCRYLWEENLVSYKNIQETLTYQKNGATNKQIYDIIYQYKVKDVEPYYPDITAYKVVADIFEF